MNKIKRIIIVFTLLLVSLLSFSIVAKADMATDNLNAIANPGAHPENPIAQEELDDEDNDNNNQKAKKPKTNNENKEIKDNNEQKDKDKDEDNKGVSHAFVLFESTLGLIAVFAFVQMIFCMVKY